MATGAPMVAPLRMPARNSARSCSIFMRPPRPKPCWRRQSSRSTKAASRARPAGRPETSASRAWPWDSPAVEKRRFDTGFQCTVSGSPAPAAGSLLVSFGRRSGLGTLAPPQQEDRRHWLLLRWLGGHLEGLGAYSQLSGRAFRNFFARPFYGGDALLQLDGTLSTYGQISRIGSLVALSLVRELGPVLTGLMVAGRNAAGMASELGSMVVTEQVDAMRALGTDPGKKLVAP